MTDPRRTEYLPLSGLTADPRNPKAHDLDTIDASLGRFGYLEPIVRDDRTGYIISGHGRAKTLTAMRERGETPPEGVKTDKAGGWLVPVVTGWASRTDTEAVAALIALNRTTELGGWVDDALLELLDDLAGVEGGLDGVGCSEADRDALRELTDRAGELDLSSVTPLDESESPRLDELDPKPCVKCGYDNANDPEALRRTR